MEGRTPASWLANEMEKLELLLEQNHETIHYFEAEVGQIFLLTQFSGFRAMQAYCLAAGDSMVVMHNAKFES